MEQDINQTFKEHTDKNPNYVLCNPNTDLGNNNYLKKEIDPYKPLTIDLFLDVEEEKEKDNRIKQLIKFLIKNHDAIAQDKALTYLKEKHNIKNKILDKLILELSKEIKEEEEKKKINPILFKVDNYMDNVERFHQKQPFFYDKTKIFWMWDNKEYKYDIVDEIDIMNSIEKELVLMGETISTTVKNNYLEAIKRYGRKKIPKEAPKKWIQFKDKAFSLTSKKIYTVTPDYLFCNPIPWEMGKTSDTPTINKLFTEWVGLDYLPTLFEIIAYCSYTCYPIHLAFCFIGAGRNGKTQYQKLIEKFFGMSNIAATELDAITNPNNRFETFKMYRKLVALMGETNFGIINHSSTFKKLTGGDLMGYEKKGKDGFDDYSYAKLLINSNSLPTSEDTSEGFYRRWLIIDFPNKFEEGKDIIDSIPEQEFNNLAKKVTEILPKLLEIGKFSNQGTIEQRKDRYIAASNPLLLFIRQYCVEDPNGYVRYGELYNKYSRYLLDNNKRVVSKKEFSKTLGFEGIDIRKTSKEGEIDTYAEGIRLKDRIGDF